MAIIAVHSTPPAGAQPFGSREDPGEVALINEAAIERDMRQLITTTKHQRLCLLDASIEQPLMWRGAGRCGESPPKMAGRQATLRGEVRD